MRLRDRAFQLFFAHNFVYTILFEDAEVDERILDIQPDSTILSISGAGCGVAGTVSQHPRSVDAVDINQHHLALTALKAAAAQKLAPFSRFYDLCGRGWVPEPERVLRDVLSDLPVWIQRHWKSHLDVFKRSLYQSGWTNRVFRFLRNRAQIDATWLLRMCALTPAQREAELTARLGSMLHQPLVKAWLRSPLQLVALGINFTQRDRLLETEGMGIVPYFMEHLRRVAHTDLATNWFAWLPVAGHFNHELPDAVPPYLRKDRWERSIESPTRMRFHHRNIFSVLEEAGSRTWSHYTLCDAPDWMPPPVQRRLLSEIFRTSRDGARVLVRSVEDDPWIERHGLQHRFKHLTDVSARATREDRSRQYRRVDLYQVAH